MPDVEVPRDRWGRPLILQPDGSLEPYARASKIGEILDDQYNLAQWQQRQVAWGVWQNPALLHALAEAGAAELDDRQRKQKLGAVVEQAHEAAGSHLKAERGTLLHSFTEEYDRGVIGLDDEWTHTDYDDVAARDLRAYAAATESLKILHIERFVANHDAKAAGTYDRLVEVDGRKYIADIKTGSIYGSSKIAMQLAVYAFGHHYDPDTGLSEPHFADRERGIVIHLPQGEARCDLYWIDIEAGGDALNIASDVKAWRGRRTKLLTPFKIN